MTDHIKKNFKIQWDQIKMMFWHPSLNPKVVSSYIFEIYACYGPETAKYQLLKTG